jgi:hypothetical protein
MNIDQNHASGGSGGGRLADCCSSRAPRSKLRVCMYVYVCVNVCVCICMYVCICDLKEGGSPIVALPVHPEVSYAYVCVCMYVCMYVCV